jgi:general secretion pathway protein I
VSPTSHRIHGFALLEVVVALAILALSFGVLYRAIGGSVRSVGDTSRYAHAIVLAESILQSQDAVPAGGWNESGALEAFQWAVTSAPYDAAGDAGVPLYRVQVAVGWNDGLRERTFALVGLLPERGKFATGLTQ